LYEEKLRYFQIILLKIYFSPVAGTDKRAVPSVQSFFAVSIPPRCAL